MGIEGAQQEVFQRAVCVSGAKEKAAPPPVAAVTARSLRPFKLPSALRSLDYGFCQHVAGLAVHYRSIAPLK